METNGKILKSVGGFYYVETPVGILVCKARGIFRLQNVSPYAGDNVTVCTEENNEPVITGINERKNFLVRPPLANLDTVLLIISTCEPKPNAYVTDKLIADFGARVSFPRWYSQKKIKCRCEEFASVYEKIGLDIFYTDNISGDGINGIKAFIKGKTSALIGNSGVGKTSLMNLIIPDLAAKTDIISRKLGRGKHTTRTVELYKTDVDTYIADTPGFSTVEAKFYGVLEKERIQYCFREFRQFENKCRFADCAHLKEQGCAVTKALTDGIISQSRYSSYEKMYEDAKQNEKY